MKEKYIWQIKYYHGAKRARATDYVVSSEFNTLKEALQFKEMDKQLRLNDIDENTKLLKILKETPTYIRYHHINTDVVFELYKILENHHYQSQLDSGDWIKI